MFIGHIGLEDRKASGIIENTIEIVKFSLNPARFSDDFPMFFHLILCFGAVSSIYKSTAH